MFSFLKKVNIFSIKTKLVLCFILLSLLPMIVFAISSYRLFISNMHENIMQYTYEVIEQVDRNMETYVMDINSILEIGSDYYVLQYLKLNDVGDIDGNRKYMVRILEYFNSLKKMKKDLDDIRLVEHNGKTTSCYGIYWTNVEDEYFFNPPAQNGIRDISVQPPHVNPFNRYVFSIGKPMDAPTLQGNPVLCIDISTQFLDRICRNIKLGKSGYIYFTDSNGRIIYMPINEYSVKTMRKIIRSPKLMNSESGSFVHDYAGSRYIVTFKTSSVTGWKIIGVSLEEEAAAQVYNIKRITVIVAICSILAVILLTFYLSSVLTNPIRQLMNLMKKASQNDLSVSAQIKTRDEIGQLGQSFNKMINRIRVLMGKVVEDQHKIRKMEMKAMQELIKPHFVYNTLDSIIGLLEQNRNDDAMSLIETLGRFFRTSLSHGKEVVPVREEIDHVRCYLSLQQFRFSNKFDYMFDIDEEALKHNTIKLILQPLVENSIYHGVRGLEKKGLIIVKGYVRQEELIFEVLDNGRGIPEDVVGKINRVLSGEETVSDENIYFGIRNVNERIKLTYGREFGLSFESRASLGTKAVINIPLAKQANYNTEQQAGEIGV